MKLLLCFLLQIVTFFSYTSLAQQQAGVYYSLEKALEHPQEVHVLDLSYQQLDFLPDVFEAFTNVETIMLRHNKLDSLPPSFYTLKSLNYLDFSFNYLIDQRDFFKNAKYLTNLEYINLSNCNLMFIPIEIEELKNLKKLNISSNALFFLPEHFSRLSNLEYLDVSNNNLVWIPNSFVQLQNLNILKLKGGGSIVNNMFASKLEYMNVHELYLGDQQVSKNIFNAKSLNKVVCENCEFTGTPILDTLWAEKLSLIYCSGYHVDSLERHLKAYAKLKYFTYKDSCKKPLAVAVLHNESLESLQLQMVGAQWNKVCGALASYSNLRYLDLSGNNLNKVPSGFKKLQQVKHINLSRNMLSNFVWTAGNSSLREINLRSNKFTSAQILELKDRMHDCKIYHDFENTSKQIKSIVDLDENKNIIAWEGENAKSFFLKSGTKIIVPENAFVDKNGSPVKGRVIFKTQEFLNPVQIFASNIPMNFDSAGVPLAFSSAGMIDLRAYQDGEELELAPGKFIDIEMATVSNEDGFNVYDFDEDKGEWDYREASSEAVVNDSVYDPFIMPDTNRLTSASFTSDFPVVSKEVAFFQIRRNSKAQSFNIVFDHLRQDRDSRRSYSKSYNELKLLSKYVFVYEGNDYDEVYKKLKQWSKELNRIHGRSKRKRSAYSTMELLSDIRISVNPESDNFLFTFEYLGESLTIPVGLVLNKNRPSQMQKEYTRFLNKYQKEYKKREQSWAVIDSLTNNWLVNAFDVSYEQQRRTAQSGYNFIPVRASTRRIRSVQLGICNIDRVIRGEDPEFPRVPLVASYYPTGSDEQVVPYRVNVVDYTLNTTLRFKQGKEGIFFPRSVVYFVLEFENGTFGLIKKEDIYREYLKKGNEMNLAYELFTDEDLLIEQLKTYLSS